MTTIRSHRATAHHHVEEHIEERPGLIGTLSGFRGPARYTRTVRRFRIFGLSKPNRESRRADSNRLPLLITSDRLCVAGVCTGLQIPHIQRVFLSAACPVLHRIAFPVVSEARDGTSPSPSQLRLG